MQSEPNTSLHPKTLTALPGAPCPQTGEWYANQSPGQRVQVKMCYLGWQESLVQLANLVEPDIPG